MLNISSVLATANTASPGPWSSRRLYQLLRYARKHYGPWDDFALCENFDSLPAEDDVEFITQARTNVPVLCAEITRLTDRIYELSRLIRTISTLYNDDNVDARALDVIIESAMSVVNDPTTPPNPLLTVTETSSLEDAHEVLTEWASSHARLNNELERIDKLEQQLQNAKALLRGCGEYSCPECGVTKDERFHTETCSFAILLNLPRL